MRPPGPAAAGFFMRGRDAEECDEGQAGLDRLRRTASVHPRCRHLIDELALYSYRTHPKTGEIQSELEDRDNHAVDALRYAVEALRRGGYDSSMKWVGTVG